MRLIARPWQGMRDGAGGLLGRHQRARDPERLERAATQIREATGAKLTPMRADINTEEGLRLRVRSRHPPLPVIIAE